MSALNERIEDGGHDEESHSASSVSKAGSQGVCSTDYVLVEEAGRPHLAGDEAAAKDAHKEPDCDEGLGAGGRTCKGGRNCTDEQNASECPSWPECITQWTSNDAN